MPPTQPNSGHRGLYVALGSFLTLAVLAAAAIEGPKFFKAHADQAAPVHQTRRPAVQETPAQDQAPVSTPVSTSDDQASPAAAAAAAASNQPLPASQADSSQQKRDQQDANQPSSTQPALVKRGAQTQPGSQAAGPSAEAQQSYRAQMRELQDQTDHLDIRVKTARAGLSSIKAQMSFQGLGLRSDVVEAEARMNYLLAKAQREISSGDAVSAEHDLEMAGYAIEFIEKFLGR